MNKGTIIESPTRRLRALLAARSRRRAERDFASRVCEESLAALHAVRATDPGLQGGALYQAVVARRSGLEPAEASAVVQRANESLEDWGHDCAARLIDVVKYMIVSEYMAQRPGTDGMIIDL
ncbi:MAG: hypothetical protein KGJ52_05025, partial [Gammaproteobacteria bacterium]|nr:hypothetical protein [Gammaproteobacteria bacterium]